MKRLDFTSTGLSKAKSEKSQTHSRTRIKWRSSHVPDSHGKEMYTQEALVGPKIKSKPSSVKHPMPKKVNRLPASQYNTVRSSRLSVITSLTWIQCTQSMDTAKIMHSFSHANLTPNWLQTWLRSSAMATTRRSFHWRLMAYLPSCSAKTHVMMSLRAVNCSHWSFTTSAMSSHDLLQSSLWTLTRGTRKKMTWISRRENWHEKHFSNSSSLTMFDSSRT